MGCCFSSSETTTNAVTGQTNTKHKMGGAFPGNRRPVNKPYTPPASQFSNGQATSHFVSYGGGNALVLKQGSGDTAQPQTGAMVATAKPPEYISITLPAGVSSGQKIQVAAPDGRLNEIIIPAGFGPGSTFTVEFADADAPPDSGTGSSKPSYTSSYGTPSSSSYATPAKSMATATATATATPYQPPPPQQGNNGDDGFATGFGRDYSSYPTATDARPVYR